MPFTANQPFWGRRVHAIGAGPKPILVKNLSVENLTQAIVEADDPVVRKRAQVIGQGIGSENGVKCAVELIESCLPNWGNFKVQLSDNPLTKWVKNI